MSFWHDLLLLDTVKARASQDEFVGASDELFS
jgi:hypothetical protein